MAKKTLSFTDSQVVITDDKNKSERIDLVDSLPTIEAIFAIRKEQKTWGKAAQGTLSLLAVMLDNPKFDQYRGKTPIGEKIAPEFRGHLRDIETEHMKPQFEKALRDKGNSEATIVAQWGEYRDSLRQGTYAMVKSYVSKLFCHLGQLPVCENGKLLPINAIKTILANAETPKETTGIAGRLVSIATDLANRTEKTDLGNLATAIAALNAMLATYEGLQREDNERKTEQLHGVMGIAQDAMTKAQDTPSIESIEAMHDNGQIDGVTYQIMMLEHHGIEIVFK